MSAAEQQRYASAVLKMMEGPAEGSPFFELAGLHGWPGKKTERRFSYCEHRQETFPGWHRAYLLAFEKALQEADRLLGNDGAIGLPYWDVLAQPELNGQVVPSIVRAAFPDGTKLVRQMLADPATTSDGPNQSRHRRGLWERGYSLVDDATLAAAIRRERLGAKALQTLWVAQHYRAASTFGSSSEDSLETPHDKIHLLAGFPLASLMGAAFHPLFWLHHCNIDRYYEAYLAYATPTAPHHATLHAPAPAVLGAPPRA